MKTYALYLRTSTNHQENGLESQKRALIEHCKKQNIENIKIYEDFGISGAKSSRPALNQMLADCKSGLIETVIVYSFSRFARSLSHLLSALDDFKKLNIGFISITENFDTNSALGRAFFSLVGTISQLERELISERVKNGLRNARAKNKQIGRPSVINKDLIKELINQNKYSYEQIAKLAKCGKSSVCRLAIGLHPINLQGGVLGNFT